ncbi:MAG: hypothetical protein IT440_06550 [Phycisphaeraceae bacterium]|nr:hypothetical protein [Phycisphaeraceae bacterium]
METSTWRQPNGLRQLQERELPLGRPLPFHVYDIFGRLFRQSGQTLQATDLRRNRRRVQRGLYVDPTTVPALDAATSSSDPLLLRRMKAGERLEHHIFDEHGRLVQAAGIEVTDRFLRQVRYRTVRLQLPEAPKQSAAATQASSAAIAKPTDKHDQQQHHHHVLHSPAVRDLERMFPQLCPRGIPVPAVHRIRPSLSLKQLRQQTSEGCQFYDLSIDRCAELVHDARRGKAPAVQASYELVAELLMLTNQDPSLAMLLMDLSSMEGGEYLFHHAANVALVAMRLADSMGWSIRDVHALGLAALLQDVGMLDVPDEVRLAPRALSHDERAMIDIHPAYTVSRLRHAPAISHTSLLIALQAHERCDQSGYPRQRDHGTIHPLAKVIHAADTFAAVTCPRPHRPACLPYSGVLTVLQEAKIGRIDHTVARAFVQAVGLFPVGSFVRLADQSLARVFRSNPRHPNQPIVVPLNDDGSETNEEIDLSISGAPAIVAALSEDEVAPGN